MPRCSCAGNSCSCAIQVGPGLTLTGTGNSSAPYTVSLASQYLSIPVPSVGALDLSSVPAGAIVEVLLSASANSVILPVLTPGSRIDLFVKQVVAGRTITWPSAVKWPGGTAPVLSSTINYGDWLAIRLLQTDWIGATEGLAIR